MEIILKIPDMNLESVLTVPPIPTNLVSMELSKSNCSIVGICL